MWFSAFFGRTSPSSLRPSPASLALPPTHTCDDCASSLPTACPTVIFVMLKISWDSFHHKWNDTGTHIHGNYPVFFMFKICHWLFITKSFQGIYIHILNYLLPLCIFGKLIANFYPHLHQNSSSLITIDMLSQPWPTHFYNHFHVFPFAISHTLRFFP